MATKTGLKCRGCGKDCVQIDGKGKPVCKCDDPNYDDYLQVAVTNRTDGNPVTELPVAPRTSPGKELKAIAVKVHDIIVERMYTTKGTRYDADLERAHDLTELAHMVATIHPFSDGNKRTAYILWKLSKRNTVWDAAELYNDVLEIMAEDEEWLNILAQI